MMDEEGAHNTSEAGEQSGRGICHPAKGKCNWRDGTPSELRNSGLDNFRSDEQQN